MPGYYLEDVRYGADLDEFDCLLFAEAAILPDKGERFFVEMETDSYCYYEVYKAGDSLFQKRMDGGFGAPPSDWKEKKLCQADSFDKLLDRAEKSYAPILKYLAYALQKIWEDREYIPDCYGCQWFVADTKGHWLDEIEIPDVDESRYDE